MDIQIHFPMKAEELESFIRSKFEHHSDEDLLFSIYEHRRKKIAVFGIGYSVDVTKLEEFLLSPLLNHKRAWTTQAILDEIPLENGTTYPNLNKVLNDLVIGSVFVYIENETKIIAYPMKKEEKREISPSETEAIILGPQFSFIESLDANLNMMRQLIPTADLAIEKVIVGTDIPREVRILYMKSVANEADVNTMRQRIQDIDVEGVHDISELKQYLEDNTFALFPQLYITELPTRTSYDIRAGKIAVLAEDSSNAFIGPATFFSFFETTDDSYLRWMQASFLRLLRFIAIPISLFLTALYVAVVNFQYELVPTSLIITIGQSRAGVPFPPLIEALIIELMIELLREAGARLPTKIGETMGIVGGLVIGTAAVEAGITSNILIVIVAASALASFTTPNYLVGTSFRIVRFIMIVLAGFYGLIGVVFGACFIIIHLLRMKSLGRPFLSPLYPLQLQDFKNVFFRAPPSYDGKYATMYRPKKQERYPEKKARKIKDVEE